MVAILNDTTGTLVAGAHDYPDCAIGLILGTIHISYSDMIQAPSLLITPESNYFFQFSLYELCRRPVTIGLPFLYENGATRFIHLEDRAFSTII